MRVFSILTGVFCLCTSASPDLDLRVSKALGTHGYNSLRISAIDHTANDFFTYNAHFQHRWTDHTLSSVLLTDLAEGSNQLNISNQLVTVNVPKQGTGVRGIIFADPCSNSSWISCHSAFKTFTRTPALLNAAVKGGIEYWGVIGDNWYDENSTVTEQFYEQLTQEVKQTIMWTVPGNHDFWVKGSPFLRHEADQYGNGFMQWYAQDAMSGKNDTVNFRDFSVDPSSHHPASVDNFVWYHVIGDIGFVGVSGAHYANETEVYLEEACAYFEKQKPEYIFVTGHWNDDDVVTGVKEGMATPSVWKRAKKYKGCSGSKTRYLMGHTHCNQVRGGGDGFMVGAAGMKNSGECGLDKQEEWGMLFVDTLSEPGRQLVVMYTVANTTLDQFQQLEECFAQAEGPAGCTHLGDVWLNASSTGV